MLWKTGGGHGSVRRQCPPFFKRQIESRRARGLAGMLIAKVATKLFLEKRLKRAKDDFHPGCQNVSHQKLSPFQNYPQIQTITLHGLLILPGSTHD